MCSLITTVEATLRFSAENAPDLYDLSGPISWCLRQADIRIMSHDVAIADETISFVTDHGTIRLSASKVDKRVEISIAVEAESETDDTVARQICYQLTRRLTSRLETISVVWEPTHQILRPTQFKWGVLADMPNHFGHMQGVQPASYYGSALN